jgi:zinc and cadmium transporter
MRLTHVQFQRLLSIVGGMLLGIGLFHQFPHAVHELDVSHIDFIVMWVMSGILMMFFLLRTFHVHHHEPDTSLVSGDEPTPAEISVASAQAHSCSHDHAHQRAHSSISWAGMLFGLRIHTLLDAVALGASMHTDALHGPNSWWGLGVLLGIALHIPLDSLSYTSLMLGAKRTKSECIAANLIYSLLCPVGAALFLWGVGFAGDQATTVIGAGLAFSAGLFLCIALADLLPEMEFHTHHQWQLSAYLLTGVALAWGMRFLEPAHLHP